MSMSTVGWAVLVVLWLLILSTNKASTILMTIVFIGGVLYVPYSMIFGRGKRYKPNPSRFGRRPGR